MNAIKKTLVTVLLSTISLSAAAFENIECNLWPLQKYAPDNVSEGQRAIDCMVEKFNVNPAQVYIVMINEETSQIIVEVTFSSSKKSFILNDTNSENGE